MVVERQKMTVAEFDKWALLPENIRQDYEFIDGEIVSVVSNPKSSKLGAKINRYIGTFVDDHDLGHVTGADGGYQVGDERYIPDVGFIAYEKMPELLNEEGYVPAAPSLAVEVLSPSDRNSEMLIKLGNYLAAGTVVWVLDPDKQELAVYVPNQPVKVYKKTETFTDGGIFKGFSLELSILFK